jgi:hypothetical protein
MWHILSYTILSFLSLFDGKILKKTSRDTGKSKHKK